MSPIPDIPTSSEVAIASRGSLILSDFLLIVITWFGVSRPRRPLNKNTFAGVLLRDGEQLLTLYSLRVLGANATPFFQGLPTLCETVPLRGLSCRRACLLAYCRCLLVLNSLHLVLTMLSQASLSSVPS